MEETESRYNPLIEKNKVLREETEKFIKTQNILNEEFEKEIKFRFFGARIGKCFFCSIKESYGRVKK